MKTDALLDAIDPRCIKRRYTVHVMGFHGGTFECFWTRRKAKSYFDEQVRNRSREFITMDDDWRDIEVARFERGDNPPTVKIVAL